MLLLMLKGKEELGGVWGVDSKELVTKMMWLSSESGGENSKGSRITVHPMIGQQLVFSNTENHFILKKNHNFTPSRLMSYSSHHALAKRACDHFSNSPTPFHNCATIMSKLDAAGYTRLHEDTPFKGAIKANGRYYYTRNTSTIVAFLVGGKYDPSSDNTPGGFKIIGGHTDSPNLRIKPHSKRSSNGCTQLSVECYGGGLWETWFDRDLSVAGRVMVRDADGKMIRQQLVKIDRPLIRVPSLCIHLKTGEERAAFKYNKEEHLQPVLAGEVKSALTGEKRSSPDDASDASDADQWVAGHEPMLMQAVAEELKIDVKQIVDFELMCYDTQDAALGGMNNEFLYSARLDNQGTCFVCTEALVQYDLERLKTEVDVSMVCLFDHEEVGSASQCGAGSPIMSEAVRRVVSAMTKDPHATEDALQIALRKSFCFR